MAAISLWRTIQFFFLFSLSDEISTCTKVRLADFQKTGTNIYPSMNFCKWPKTSVYHGAIIQWCKNPILSTMYSHYPELENKLTYYITIIINI